MRCYKLGYAGGSGQGVAPLQILNTGRVRSVSINGYVETVAATTLGSLIEVGINGLAENGSTLSTPNNFAHAAAVAVGAAAAAGATAVNFDQDTDYPVTAGQQIVLNITESAIAGAAVGTYALDVLVWIG